MAWVRDLNETVEQLIPCPGQTRVFFVVGPDGRLLNRGNLPPSDTTRWVRRRKLEVVVAIEGGLLSLDEACQRYSLTAEEFQVWQSLWCKGAVPNRIGAVRSGLTCKNRACPQVQNG